MFGFAPGAGNSRQAPARLSLHHHRFYLLFYTLAAMPYQQDVPWPSTSCGPDEARSPSYFPPGLDQGNPTPNASSQYAPSSSFHVVQGSELPKHSRGSTPPSPTSPSVYPRSRKITSVSAGADGSPLPRTRSGPLPLTSSSTIVKSSPTPFVRPEDVWREILKTAYGRDKVFVSHPLTPSIRIALLSAYENAVFDELGVRKLCNIRCGSSC